MNRENTGKYSIIQKIIKTIIDMLVFSLKMFIVVHCGLELIEYYPSLLIKCFYAFIMFMAIIVVIYNTFIAKWLEEEESKKE
ncbi:MULTISPECIES: hypothetical protein [Aerococcus]|uniref:hypothetical protein n=1 Tax=Aerococcus TaxID=1375 RepID=UPI0018A74606|nr:MULTISPECIES: hypothetical protein [Aerococcus]MCY3067622.1 hypothetical protein [Aerococcus mictus]MCY3080476.1 hypothetical protein [Aerococcus mictus]MDK8484539.1 hypothetical protein [Aerococcus urinae]